jgi:hypothetical protein
MTMSKLISAGKALIAFAALWALGVSLVILFTPVEIHEIEAVVVPGGDSTPQETITYQSWYQVQGAWGVAVLFIFAGLYALPAWLARRTETRWIWLALASLLALTLTFLAGFSIGGFYLPAALALLAGVILLAAGRAGQKDS